MSFPRKHYRTRRCLIALTFMAVAFSLAGCTHQSATQSTTLYERLGGQDTIDTVVENLLYRIADDPEVVVFFANTNIDLFAKSLASQLCDVSDGPCRYEGPPMDRAHQHMGLTDVHFNRLVEHLDAAMQEEGIALGARNELLGRLAPMYAGVMRLQ
ncbi:group 1 truncated hemoglobin [Halomonas sp. FeN2]|uniref:Group 1 truncated hemoglobin n=1 Tax=Vreelandella neptunia TaxID=115551 RepID=A0ABZ0YTG7_9GAMM|nr:MULTISPECIES: group 1 truncated hemoglobin [Halomonas]MBF59608.1 group 1 truncated hemoglobin [Halomonas sp.]MDN3561621.1 group 1 truncated hemoglobin [Halomonas neptunia]UBR49742.1 group 1 truncated hemoglobin [Halomonas sp. FeN2]WQH14525.1 group 1 truncated hemoglobin [Halomonas neptunia]